ncbi:MAG: HDOD domain-containing protein [Deltaproteobacteria bacterium]|nr:HDOD domain-containing protein [Deltaproteobacteria bacterium]
MDNSNGTNLKDLIRTLLFEIEKNDPFMRNHAERVAATGLRFAKWLELDRQEANLIYISGLLHDIGYIFIPPNIAQKREQLTEDVTEIIKRHPLISEKIVSKYPILKDTMPIIRYHHESVDGSGYPDGIKGEEIPLGAKILNLVNWFDTMTITRSQSSRISRENALADIEKMAGTKFDKGLSGKFISFIRASESSPAEGAKGTEGSEDKDTPLGVRRQEATHISRDIIQDIIAKFKKDEIDLPVLSKVVHEIQDTMNNPATTVDQLALIIERDAVISVRLIAVANSVIYRGTDKILTVKDAIPRIGVKETHSIITTISSKSIYETGDKRFKKIMEKLWLHSLASGYAARNLSMALKLGEIEKFYFMGLVHDIGKALLLKAFSDMYSKDNTLDIGEIMAAIHEAHTSFGGAILRKWGYSETLVRIPLLHEGPDFRPDTDREILTVNLASCIANNMAYGLEEDSCDDPSKIQSARLLDAGLGMIEDIMEEVKTLMDGVSGVL